MTLRDTIGKVMCEAAKPRLGIRAFRRIIIASSGSVQGFGDGIGLAPAFWPVQGRHAVLAEFRSAACAGSHSPHCDFSVAWGEQGVLSFAWFNSATKSAEPFTLPPRAQAMLCASGCLVVIADDDAHQLSDRRHFQQGADAR